ncbi:hypothetical protein Pan241w_11710 [Gimesia alba]|uniref:Uncharacterized protein n=1 Tax=Gimesia alba TaxID=2527973 RepID=A0A517RB51_9PLAN|nr:hypothetical protein [Gimesia alba]QDT41112.1 hypothetical protein Pan241w_11710 [Gimesia alba]
MPAVPVITTQTKAVNHGTCEKRSRPKDVQRAVCSKTARTTIREWAFCETGCGTLNEKENVSELSIDPPVGDSRERPAYFCIPSSRKALRSEETKRDTFFKIIDNFRPFSMDIYRPLCKITLSRLRDRYNNKAPSVVAQA